MKSEGNRTSTQRATKELSDTSENVQQKKKKKETDTEIRFISWATLPSDPAWPYSAIAQCSSATHCSPATGGLAEGEGHSISIHSRIVPIESLIAQKLSNSVAVSSLDSWQPLSSHRRSTDKP